MKSVGRKKINFLAALRWLGTFLSAALFLWLIARQNWSVVLESSRSVAWWAIVVALALYILSSMFNTLRWCLLLWAQDVEISYARALQIVWAGNFTSNFLPSTIGGDGFRMLAVYPYARRKTLAVGSVALDRIINMAAMVCLVPLPLWFFGGMFGSLVSQMGIILPAPLNRLFEKYLPKISNAYQIWAARPLAFVYAFIAAWPSNLFFTLAVFVIARQLNLPVSFAQALAVQTVTYFVSLLPISVNGYGLRELTYTALYTALGVSTEQASTLALLTRFLNVAVTLPGALWISKIAALPQTEFENDLDS